jgi:hypothetical protein
MPEQKDEMSTFEWRFREAGLNAESAMAGLVRNKLDLAKEQRLLDAATTRLSVFQAFLRRLPTEAVDYFSQGTPLVTEVCFFVRKLELNGSGAIMLMEGFWAKEMLADGVATQAAILDSDHPGKRRHFPDPVIDSVTAAALHPCERCSRKVPVVGRRDLMKWDLDDSEFMEAAYALCLDCLRLTKIAETVYLHRSHD